ncbi:MAG: glycosyltransferase, partial [Lachnospiraceae bacterium]|nr:glycosyltransferase [Lachnospiraceae bacterium]
VGLQKIVQVNNGVDLEEFEHFRGTYRIADRDLEDEKIFKVVYTGSIRKANHLEILIGCAEQLKKKGSNIKFLIWGDGDYRESLMKKCDCLGLNNIVFKGRVEKKYIPYIVSRADVNLMHGKITGVLRFGISLNKLFDYLAAGRPIFSDLDTEYDLVAPYGCGVTVKKDTAEEIANGLYRMEKQPKDVLQQYGKNAAKLAKEFDYKKLSDKMEKLFLEVCAK